MIWTEAILNQYVADASIHINNEEPCLFHRYYLATTAGTAAYQLADKVKTIRKITWRGVPLIEMSWIAFQALDEKVDSVNVKATNSKPFWYTIHPNNSKTISLYPTPNESFLATGGDPYSPVSDEARCTITCWRFPDDAVEAATLPGYIAKRMVKAFVLWKAFSKEGKGQNLKASEFYKNKYLFCLSYFKKINAGVFVANRHALSDGVNLGLNKKPARPSLPSNFERTRLY